MPAIEFTSDELGRFLAWFGGISGSKAWRRREGGHGEDVLEIVVVGATACPLKVAKVGDGRFLATGFDGWALTVSDDFDGLLGILARMDCLLPRVAVDERRPSPRPVGAGALYAL
ncbi:MAG: hypothetical protein ACFCUO_02185 [Rhodospirillales bacterium]